MFSAFNLEKNIFLFVICQIGMAEMQVFWVQRATIKEFLGLNLNNAEHPQIPLKAESEGSQQPRKKCVSLLLTNCILLFRSNKMRAQHFESPLM